jgi:predicted transcriptional regulator of viral defense system
MSVIHLPRAKKGILADARWEPFLKTLTGRLAEPTPDLPSVRCVTRQTLVHLIGEAADELRLPSTFPTGKKVIEHLVSMGFASHVPIEEVSKPGPSRDFILLGIQESRELQVDPLELLQAFDQQGVVCYFSALSYYDLTTQIPASHHVASLITHKAEPAATSAEKLSTSPKGTQRSKLGTHVFSYGGVPFYSTKRARKSIPGIKTRVLGPATNIRIATVEQTLLDTLQYPFHCGGPAVVLESWERQTGTTDEDLFLAYLKAIQIQPLTRRVGALFELLGIPATGGLGSYLDATKKIILEQPETPWIPLLRGVSYSRESAAWKVMVP